LTKTPFGAFSSGAGGNSYHRPSSMAAKTTAGHLRLSGAARGWVEVYDALVIHPA